MTSLLMFVTSEVQRSVMLNGLKFVNNKRKINMTYVSSHLCLGSLVVRKKEFQLKGFISLEEINLSRQKQSLNRDEKVLD